MANSTISETNVSDNQMLVEPNKRNILIISGKGEEFVKRYTHIDLTPENLESRQMTLKQLSEEELQVVEQLIQGKSPKQMQDTHVALNEQAVYRLLQSLREKLDVPTNEAMIARVYQMGIDMWLVDVKKQD